MGLIEKALAIVEAEFDEAEKKILKRWEKHIKEVGLKHLPGQHDQSSHGSWAHGSKESKVSKVILNFEENYTKPYIFTASREVVMFLQFESGCGVDADGEFVWQGTSNERSRITIPRDIFSKMVGGTFSHNHPSERTILSLNEDGEKTYSTKFDVMSISQPPSSTDVITAAFFNFQEMRIIGYEDGKVKVFRVIRPPSGVWPSRLMDAEYLGEKMRAIHPKVMAEHPEFDNPPAEGVDISRFSYEVLNRVWTEAAEELGFIYKVEAWKSS